MNRIRLALLIVALCSAPVVADDAVAPDWLLESADGHAVRLSDAVVDRPVVLFFWASWCPFCKALMPHLQSIRIEYGEAVGILALNFRDDGDPVGFIRERGYDFTILPNAEPVAALYGVRATPGVIIVDRDQVIRFDLYDQPRPEIPPEVEERGRNATAAYLASHWAAAIRRQLDAALDSN